MNRDVRFLLYNIRYAAGVGPRFHLPIPYSGYLKNTVNNLENIVGFIKSVKPDIIGLVEVDGGSYRSENLCQAELIAGKLGHYHVIHSKYDQRSVARKMPVLKSQANALLAKQEIINHSFRHFSVGMKRLVIEAEFADLTVFLVHLSLTFRKRQLQLEQLYQFVRGVDGPVIVAGDFNVLWGDRELELFLGATGLASANGSGEFSHPSSSPRRELDFILHSKDLVARNFKVPSVQFSDHSPLFCDFSFR